MQKKYWLYILLSVLLNACHQTKKEIESNSDVIKVNVKEAGLLNYNNHFYSTTIVPLETRSESLIGQIEKLYLTTDHIIIFDSKGMNILLFGIDGRFIRKIGNKGSGPEEYLFFNDIQFDKVNSVIYAHERFQNCIHTYDLYGHLVEKTDKFDVDFNSFFKTDKGYWIYSCFKSNNPNGYNLMLLDNDAKTVKKTFFPQKAFINASSSSTFMDNEAGKLFFLYPSSNIVYELNNEDAIPFVKIDFGDKTMPYDIITNMDNMDEYDKIISDKRYLGDISGFKINNKCFYFSFRETGFNIATTKYNCYYNYQIKQTSIYKNPYIDSVNYPISTELLYASDSILIYPMDLMVLTDDSFTVLSKNLSIDLHFDSNPVLAIFSLR
jgi:hypothetical protein